MREFIKKFESAILADGYVIKDIPFTTSVATDPIQNLVCNETGKHLENNNGIVIICPQDIPNNEICYWGEYYDLENVISVLGQQFPYAGPTILSNEKVGDKYVITFDGPVTKLGAAVIGEETGDLYPIFINNPEMGILCNITDIKIPNSVTNIEYAAFGGCSNLTSVTIPNSVTSIGDGAFENCTGLTSVTIPNSVTNIGDGAFENCTGLTSITIPNSVTTIGVQAFYYCSSLASVEIPNSVTSIENQVFEGCTGLTSVTIPNSVTSIGEYAFINCSGLTSVTIPNSVTNIEYGAFSGCSSLTSVTIPNSVTNIGDYAFRDCSGLTSVICQAITPPTLGQNAWFGLGKTIPIYVPAESVDAYKAAANWSTYADRIQAIP